MLKRKFQEELKQSMLAKNRLRTSVLRMLLSALNYHEINKGGAGYEATDKDVLSVVQKEIKQRKDSIEQFQKAGRKDLVDKEARELEILQKYLPEQMNEEEIKTIVKQTIQAVNATSMQDIGKVISAVMPKLKGKADESLVSKIVKEKLSFSL